MRVLISGNGRTCSNWMLTIIAGTGLFKLTRHVEDRNLPVTMKMHEGYASKLCIENKGVTLGMFENLLDKYDDLRLLWCLRHPVANALAKIERGCDRDGVPRSVDSTKETACESIERSYRFMEDLSKTNRIVGVRQEGLILRGDDVIRGLFGYLGINGGTPKYRDAILMNFKYTPNAGQAARYGDKIDMSQAEVHKNPYEAYGGYFANKKDVVEYIRDRLNPLVEKWYKEKK